MAAKRKKTQSEKKRARSLANRESFNPHDFLGRCADLACYFARSSGYILTGAEGFDIGSSHDDPEDFGLIIPASAGWMAKLPCLPEERRKEYEAQYREQIKDAVAKYGSDFNNWEDHVQELFPKAGEIRVMLNVTKDGSRFVILNGAVFGVDDNEEEIVRMIGFPPVGVRRVDIKDEKSKYRAIFEIAHVIALDNVYDSLTNREIMNLIFSFAYDEIDNETAWNCERLDNYDKFLLVKLYPYSTEDVKDKFLTECEKIMGTVVEPSFNRKFPLFIIVAKAKDPLQSDWKINAYGPIAYNPGSIEDERKLIDILMSDSEPIMSMEVDIKTIVNRDDSDEDPCTASEAIEAFKQSLISNIFETLGIVRYDEEEQDKSYSEE